MKNLLRARPKLSIFWNWTHKNTPDRHKCVAFGKSEKSAKTLHPTTHIPLFLLFFPSFLASFYVVISYSTLYVVLSFFLLYESSLLFIPFFPSSVL